MFSMNDIEKSQTELIVCAFKLRAILVKGIKKYNNLADF